MNLTKNQKRYASILGVCLFAFAADRLLLSSPSGASADAITPVPAVSSKNPTQTAPKNGDTTLTLGGAQSKTKLAAMLDEIAEERSLDPMNVRDALRAPSHWLPAETGYTEPTVDDTAAARAKEAFLDEHVLNAVMANGGAGYAVIDGRSLRVGELLDGFTLVEVRSRSVVFEANGVEAELLLPKRELPGSKP